MVARASVYCNSACSPLGVHASFLRCCEVEIKLGEQFFSSEAVRDTLFGGRSLLALILGKGTECYEQTNGVLAACMCPDDNELMSQVGSMSVGLVMCKLLNKCSLCCEVSRCRT